VISETSTHVLSVEMFANRSFLRHTESIASVFLCRILSFPISRSLDRYPEHVAFWQADSSSHLPVGKSEVLGLALVYIGLQE
jgi:hypothetical protein